MKQHTHLFTIDRMSKVFRVSRSGYYEITSNFRTNLSPLPKISTAFLIAW
ncbi:MAG: hypothetical protein IBJ00_04570 [Alphaproteobacteria bacterium]|nr:hypothetical protein [Alphaproteobacteria bacterium]